MPGDVQLPNGLRIACLQKHEVPLVHLEIESYFENGVHLNPGDTVFDVGANIGLFSLTAIQRCDRDLRVFAFEPVKDLFDLLSKNVERNGAAGLIEPLAFGLSSEAKSVEFAFYPRAPVLCTAYPDEEGDVQVMKEAVLNSIMYLEEAPVALRCLRWLPMPLRSHVVQFALARTLRPRSVTCQMQTLSGFMRDRGIERVDFLKIDVERAELDVLRGIEAADWPKIRQVVVEVHDIQDRLQTIKAMLAGNGFDQIVVSQPPTLDKSNIYVVFAKREKATKAKSEAGPSLGETQPASFSDR